MAQPPNDADQECVCGCEERFAERDLVLALDGFGGLVAYDHLARYEADLRFDPRREYGTWSV